LQADEPQEREAQEKSKRRIERKIKRERAAEDSDDDEVELVAHGPKKQKQMPGVGDVVIDLSSD
jgi:hypothetical protein